VSSPRVNVRAVAVSLQLTRDRLHRKRVRCRARVTTSGHQAPTRDRSSTRGQMVLARDSTGILKRRGTPCSSAADRIDCRRAPMLERPPVQQIGSQFARSCIGLHTYNSLCSCCRTENATYFHRGRLPAAKHSRPAPLHNSVPVPLASFQILSLVLPQKHTKDNLDPVGERNPVPSSARFSAAEASAVNQQAVSARGPFGLACVTIRRRPSALGRQRRVPVKPRAQPMRNTGARHPRYRATAPIHRITRQVHSVRRSIGLDKSRAQSAT